MELFTLNQNHKTGIKFIDEQHFQLSEHIKEIFNLYNNGSSNEIIFNKMQDFLFLVKYHFNAEENFMTELKYENYYSHKIEHDRCIRKIIEFQGNLYNYERCIPDFYEFIKNWLTNHLMFKDIRLGNFLLQKGIN